MSPAVELHALARDGLRSLADDRRRVGAAEHWEVDPVAATLRDVARRTAQMYDALGATAPWVSYLATDVVSREVVGICSFVGAPTPGGEVEIAYHTFAPFEGRGYATAMAQRLLAIAAAADPAPVVVAHTPATEGSSTRILASLGFTRTAELEDPDDGTIWRWHHRT